MPRSNHDPNPAQAPQERDHPVEDLFHPDDHHHERSIPTILKVAVLLVVAGLSVLVGWLLR